MSILTTYIKLIEQTYLVKVVDWSYGAEKGWDPMVIRFQEDQFQCFLKYFGGNGSRHGVKYIVTIHGDVKFMSHAGQLIEDVLETVTEKRRNRE